MSRNRGRTVFIGAAATIVAIVIIVVAVIALGSADRRHSEPGAASPSPTASPGPVTASTLNRCGADLSTRAASPSGLVLTVTIPAPARAAARTIEATVTLTNTGTSRVTGSTPATPIVTLSRHSRVLWHSNGAMTAMAALVDLAPGASMRYPASFAPLRCSAEDETRPYGFRADLPHVPAGTYDVSAALDFSSSSTAGGAGSSELVTGPSNPIALG